MRVGAGVMVVDWSISRRQCGVLRLDHWGDAVPALLARVCHRCFSLKYTAGGHYSDPRTSNPGPMRESCRNDAPQKDKPTSAPTESCRNPRLTDRVMQEPEAYK